MGTGSAKIEKHGPMLLKVKSPEFGKSLGSSSTNTKPGIKNNHIPMVTIRGSAAITTSPNNTHASKPNIFFLSAS